MLFEGKSNEPVTEIDNHYITLHYNTKKKEFAFECSYCRCDSKSA